MAPPLIFQHPLPPSAGCYDISAYNPYIWFKFNDDPLPNPHTCTNSGLLGAQGVYTQNAGAGDSLLPTGLQAAITNDTCADNFSIACTNQFPTSPQLSSHAAMPGAGGLGSGFAGSFGMECWYLPQVIDGRQQVLYEYSIEAAVSPDLIRIYQLNGELFLYSDTSSPGGLFSAGNLITLNTGCFVAVVYDNATTTIHLYFNGAEINNGNFPLVLSGPLTPGPAGDKTIHVGARQSGNPPASGLDYIHLSNGLMQHFAAYTYAPSAVEIAERWAMGA